MTESESAPKARRAVSARRLVLLATVGALAAGALFVQPWNGVGVKLPAISAPTYAQSAQRPVGFADVVEKVKPAVANALQSACAGESRGRVSPFGRASHKEPGRRAFDVANWASSKHDNALAETVIGLFKTEVIHRRGPWRSLEAVEYATLEWVDWFNNRRLLEPIGNIPPAEAEANYYATLEEPRMAA